MKTQIANYIRKMIYMNLKHSSN